MSEAPEGMISLGEFSKLKGITAVKTIDIIRGGFYLGRKIGEDWFVDALESSESNNMLSNTKGAGVVSRKRSLRRVIVTDMRMPFLSMVVFMIKWVIASIPALIILTIILSVIDAMFGWVIPGLIETG